MFQQIVVALDGSAEAERILPHVEALAKGFASKVELVWATESPEMIVAETLPVSPPEEPALPVDPLPLVQQEHQDAASYLAGVAERMHARGISVSYEDPEGSPSDVILETASRLGADLIALTTHGRGAIGRLVLGSVAADVVQRASCPVLVIRRDGGQESAA